MKKARLYSLLLAMMMLLAPVFSLVSAAVSVPDTATIPFNEPAIPAIVGSKIDLSAYKVEFAEGKAQDVEFMLDGKTITEYTPAEKGVTKLTAKAGDSEKSVYVVAKNESDSEYVLYHNDFNDNAALDDLTTIGSASLVSVKDGKLVINATSTDTLRVLLPEWLGEFGNYCIETSSMVARSTDTGRWQSIMFRIQGNNYPYYQMCVRRNAAATNGVEFALRTPSNAWDVQVTGSYIESQRDNTYYTLKVEVKDNIVKESVNDMMCVWSSNDKTYKTGRVGLQVNFSEVYFDYVKITLQTEKPERDKANSTTLTTAGVKNITNSLANVAFVDDKSVLENLKDAHSVILKVNGSNVVDKNGAAIFELSKLYDNIPDSIIPVFYAPTKADADSVYKFIISTNSFDFTIISDDPDVVKYLRQRYARIRGAVDFSSKYTSLLTDEDISAIRLAVNSSRAKTALLNISCLDKETVIKLQSLNINVWVTDNDGELSVADGIRLLVSGANGVVTNSPSTIAAGYELFDANSLTRTPLIIGHRGNPTNAPENSIAGYLLAYENGADILETDVYLSADNEVVIMHNDTIDATTDGTGSVEAMTVEQLKQYHVWADNSTFQQKYPDEVIPTLRDLFEAVKDTDALIFIEIKSGKAAICDKIVELIEEYDFSERVCIISFNATQLQNMQRLAPQITCGYLMSAPGSSYSAEEAGEQLYNVIQSIQPYNTSYNPNYGNQSKEFVDACTERGITVWPWTYSGADNNSFSSAFRWGYNGLTTNDCQLTANLPRIINASATELTLEPNATGELTVNARTYNRKESDVSSRAEMVVIEGNGVVEYDDGVITAVGEGTAVVMFKYSARLLDAKPYVLYTSPVTITVSAKQSEQSTTSDESETEPVSPEQSQEPSEAIESSDAGEAEQGVDITTIILIVAAAVIVVAVVVIIVVKKSKSSK